MRIVSLLPSATEILFDLGAGDDVVGVTFECDYPPQARARTVVSTSSLTSAGAATPDPAAIDAAVRERLAAGADLYHLDRDALAQLRADLVITQDLCAVCAVDVTEVYQALDFLGCRAEVLTTDPHSLEQVWQSIHAIGRATEREPAAAQLIAGLRTRLARLPGATSTDGVRMAVLEWSDPPFAPGHWVPEMVTWAGAHNALGTAAAPSVSTTWQEVLASEPEIIVSAPCGFALDDSREIAEQVAAGPLRDWLNADPRRELWAVDANASFARPGPRLVDGIEALHAIARRRPASPALAIRVGGPSTSAR